MGSFDGHRYGAPVTVTQTMKINALNLTRCVGATRTVFLAIKKEHGRVKIDFT